MYQFVVYLHLLSAITWVGGTLFLVMVIMPLARSGVLGPAARSGETMAEVGRKFRTVAWASIVVLVGSGIYIAIAYWGISPGQFFTGSGPVLEILQPKVGLVFIAVVLSAVHDFILGPRVTRAMQESRAEGGNSGGAGGRRRLLQWIGRINLVLMLAIVALGLLLVRNPLV